MQEVVINGTRYGLPFADLLPPLTGEEYAALRADIEQRGIIVPVILDEAGNVIDGQHRIKVAADILRDTGELVEIPAEIRPGLSGSERESLAYDLNLHRRQLNKEQRQEIVVTLRKRELSTRQIAEKLNVSQPTVLNDLKAAGDKNLSPASVTGRDGKTYPARQAARVRVDNADEAGRALRLLEESPELPGRTLDLVDLQRNAKEQRREQQREENRQLVEQTAPPVVHVAGERYQSIVLDPPWDWGDEGDVDQLGRARPTYHTMTIDEVRALSIPDLAAANAHVYLWITNRSLPKGFALLDAWGFRYITCLTWCKPHFGMGNYFRGSTEQVLFGVRGSLPLLRRDVGTHFIAPRSGPHSSKPDEFYQLVETCSPGPWLELFARQQRKGWATWGAESAA